VESVGAAIAAALSERLKGEFHGLL